MKTMVLADGRTLAYRDLGDGPPLVLLHGWGMAGSAFAPLAALLADRYRLLIPDLSGHGGSTPGEGYGLDDFGDDLVEWSRGLALQRINLLGWSLGGMVALRLTRRALLPINRLVLVATTPRFVTGDDWAHGQPEGQVRILSRNAGRDLAATRAQFFASLFTAEELAAAELAACAAAVPLPQREAALGGLETLRSVDLRTELAAVRQPTLVLHGSADPIIPVAAGRFLATSLAERQLVELPGLGHAPFLSQPHRCAAPIRDFLA